MLEIVLVEVRLATLVLLATLLLVKSFLVTALLHIPSSLVIVPLVVGSLLGLIISLHMALLEVSRLLLIRHFLILIKNCFMGFWGFGVLGFCAFVVLWFCVWDSA